MQLHIQISADKITATPSGFNKDIKNAMAKFGGAQKPWKWNGDQWVIEGVEYWAERVKSMFAGWNQTWVANNILIEDNR